MDVLSLRGILTLDKGDFDRGLEEADSKSGSFGDKFKSKMGKAAKAGAVALGAFAVSSVKVGADFDKSMSQVAATMGFTVEELHTKGSEAEKAYKSLEKTARELGKSTAFSAQEAAEGLNYMALAGYDVETSQRMLPQVLNLAAAGNMDLAKASDMVTDAQSALGLSIEQTEAMVDQMARTSSLTNTNVEQLGDALLTVGGTAKIMKGGTVEASAALGVLASAGIKGSEGGTALRNILLSISGKKFEKTFKSLGVEAYDAQGKMRSLPDILTDMNKAMEGMTDEEKTKLIAQTFNVRDLKSVNALLAETPDKWKELTAAIEDSEGAAGNMAEVQLDNLAGDVTKLKSAFGELQIVVSDLDGGALRTLVQGMTEGINTIAEVLQAGSLDEAGEILSKKFSELGSFISSGLKEAIKVAKNNLPTLIGDLMTGFASFSGKMRSAFSSFVSLGLELLKNIANGIIQNIPVFIETVPVIISNFAGFINDNAPKILETGMSIILHLAQGIIAGIPTLIANLPQIAKAIIDVIKAVSWVSLGRFAINGIAKGLRAAGGALKSAITKPISATKAAIMAGFAAAKEKAVSYMEALKNGVKKKIEAAKDIVKKVVNKIKNFFPVSVGKVFSGWIPKITLRTNKGKDKASTSSSVGHTRFAKAMAQPYMFDKPTEFYAGEAGDEFLYGRSALMNDITQAMQRSGSARTINIHNTITVNGAEDPEAYMKRFVRAMEVQMRTV